jgi:hypothetical protein
MPPNPREDLILGLGVAILIGQFLSIVIGLVIQSLLR